MKSLIVSFLFLIAHASAAVHPVLRSKIIGGHNAAKGQFPYYVGIRHITTNPDVVVICGGSLLSNEWVLTSAFCTQYAKYVTVYLGSNEFLKCDICHDIYPNHITMQKDFNWRTKENDIAVIRIPFTPYTDNIQNIKLPPAYDSSQYDGVAAIASGWGFISSDGLFPNVLQYQEFSVIKNEDCEWIHPTIPDTQLCVKTERNKSPCYGDLGGPLVYRSSDGLIQIGIISFGTITACDEGAPFGFTRVSKYIHWINRKTRLQDMNATYNQTNELSNDVEVYLT